MERVSAILSLPPTLILLLTAIVPAAKVHGPPLRMLRILAWPLPETVPPLPEKFARSALVGGPEVGLLRSVQLVPIDQMPFVVFQENVLLIFAPQYSDQHHQTCGWWQSQHDLATAPMIAVLGAARCRVHRPNE